MDVEMQEDSVRSDLLEKTNDKPPTVFLAGKGDSGDLSNIADTNFSCWNSPCPISPNASGCQLKWKVSGSKGELERSQVKRRGSQVEGKPVEDLGCDDVNIMPDPGGLTQEHNFFTMSQLALQKKGALGLDVLTF
ncbi:hypothetical protein Bbelb_444830, partial [Branchiostoma belcheri]